MEEREGCRSGARVTSDVCVCAASVHSGAPFTRSATADEICSKCQAEMSVAKLLQTAQNIRRVRLLHMLGVTLTTAVRLSLFHSPTLYFQAFFFFCIFNGALDLFSLECV